MPKINYADRGYAIIVQAVADTIDFEEILITAVQEIKQAMIIHRVEFYPAKASLALLTAAGDQIELALTTNDTVDNLNLNHPEVIDKIQCSYDASLVGVANQGTPIVHDFTGCPGGGLMVPAKRICIAIDSASIGAVVTGSIRWYYTMKTLTKDDYYQLLETYNVLTQ